MTSLLDELRSAVWKGDAVQLRALLDRRPDLRQRLDAPVFPFGSTAVHHAASRGDLPMLDLLLEYGADPNRRSDWWAGGFHPLHGATSEASDRLIAAGAVADACAAAYLDRIDLLRTILADDPASVHQRGGDGQTPLHFARSRQVVDLLLDAGADPDARDVDHRSTPAQWMLQMRRRAGRYAVAAHLVARGAKADIFLAAALGLSDRVTRLLENDRTLLDLRTSRGDYGEQPPGSFHIYEWTIGPARTPLQVAAQFEQEETYRSMLRFATPRQRLIAACARGAASEARAILATDPRALDSLDEDDRRVLPDAAWAGNAAAVAVMLELGFDPFARGQDGGTALHCAAWQGQVECVKVLLAHPSAASILTLPDPTHGSTPLGWCAHGSVHCRNRSGDYPAVARQLLEAGAVPRPDIGDVDPGVKAVIDGSNR